MCFGTPANIMHSRLAYIIVCSICDYMLARPICVVVSVGNVFTSVCECGCLYLILGCMLIFLSGVCISICLSGCSGFVFVVGCSCLCFVATDGG